MGPEQSHVTDRPRYGRSASTDELRDDIAQTRQGMDETIDELGERLRPRHILDDVLDWWNSSRSQGKAGGGSLSDSLQALGSAAAHQMREHPVPSMLVGAAVAWLMFGEGEDDRRTRRSRRHLRHTELDPDVEAGIYSGSIVDARTGEPYDEAAYEDLEIGDTGGDYSEPDEGRSRVASAASRASEGARQAGEHAKDWGRHAAHGAGSAAQRAGEMAGTAREGLSSAAKGVSRAARRAASGSRRTAQRSGHWVGDVREKASRGSHAVSRTAQQGYATAVDGFTEASEDYPLAVGAGFFAAGMLSGLLLPSTRREDRMLGPMADEAKHRAKEAGEELMERGQEIAEATMEAVREEAETQGLTPSQIAERAKHVAQRAQHSVQDAAEEEGLSPGNLQEKAGEVARHAKDTAVHESKKHRDEVTGKVKEETEQGKEALGTKSQPESLGGSCEVRPEDIGRPTGL